MAGKVACVANLKGGVGKTTTAIMLAEGLSGQGHRVLAIDTDAQANFGWSFLGDESLLESREHERTLDAFMANRFLKGEPIAIEGCLHRDVSNVHALGRRANGRTSIDLLPCTPWIIDLERRMLISLGSAGCSYQRAEELIYLAFTAVLSYAREHFDWIVVDCAPGLNILTRSALSAADAIVVATVPEPLPVTGLRTFLKILWEEHAPDSGFPKPVAPNVLITRYDALNADHREQDGLIRKGLPVAAPYTVMRTVIPELGEFKRRNFFTQTLRRSLGLGGSSARIGMKLAAEVVEASAGA